MFSLRWAAAFWGILAGLWTPLWGLIELFSGNAELALLSGLATLVIWTIVATTPGAPKGSAIAYVIVGIIMFLVGPGGMTLAGPALLIAAIFGGLAARGARTTEGSSPE